MCCDSRGTLSLHSLTPAIALSLCLLACLRIIPIRVTGGVTGWDWAWCGYTNVYCQRPQELVGVGYFIHPSHLRHRAWGLEQELKDRAASGSSWTCRADRQVWEFRPFPSAAPEQQGARTGREAGQHLLRSFKIQLIFLVHVLCAQLCPTLCDPTDCSPPGSPVRGILQARILEWVATSFSRGSSRPRDRILVTCFVGRFFPAEPSVKPHVFF